MAQRHSMARLVHRTTVTKPFLSHTTPLLSSTRSFHHLEAVLVPASELLSWSRMFRIQTEERLGSLIAGAGAIWAAHEGTKGLASIWQFTLLPPGPLEVCAIGILVWLAKNCEIGVGFSFAALSVFVKAAPNAAKMKERHQRSTHRSTQISPQISPGISAQPMIPESARAEFWPTTSPRRVGLASCARRGRRGQFFVQSHNRFSGRGGGVGR